MLKKNKVEMGQCYSYHDRVFMVLEWWSFDNKWIIEDTLTKEWIGITEKELLTWRRPFDNCG